jgi:hypothetical protein
MKVKIGKGRLVASYLYMYVNRERTYEINIRNLSVDCEIPKYQWSEPLPSLHEGIATLLVMSEILNRCSVSSL